MASKLTRSNGAGWAFALPGFILLFMFIILPFFFAFWFSLTNQRLISPNPTEFVGLSNYENLLGVSVITLEPERDDAGAVVRDSDGEIAYPRVRTITRNADFPQYKGMREWFRWQSGDNATVVVAKDVVFMKALTNTLLFALIIVPLQGGGALGLALLINQKLRGINAFRAIYFTPVVISIVVISLLWRFIYDGQDGLLNNILAALTFGAFEPVDWLGNSDTALGSIIVMSAWQAMGFHMVIWLSGLQTIPATLYEVAAIEGSSSWQTFRYVTWPGLRNTAVLVLIVITMQSFALFAQIDVMTNGGPLDSTQTLVFQAVERGYGKQDISGGSTISVILFFIVLLISLIQRYLTREKR
ncbi:carbohydrate ABC transporter membrane protein 1, CUT1 family [Cohaesibacter sp. ES.047]|uniref:carbohydrate ABC transporter permease n=1 Tax=Cohaesibacter sp. ES.047 TaxID=1798205 RepID=UPI000BB98233|nr:sugar ABC transporter permease [Cohaesibacter sp. ES.047]SNY93352.1 carbohydrate ABC transporter membrane protein 1, CUT1 family [Cohaesibacter sp. ES.047]